MFSHRHGRIVAEPTAIPISRFQSDHIAFARKL